MKPSVAFGQVDVAENLEEERVSPAAEIRETEDQEVDKSGINPNSQPDQTRLSDDSLPEDIEDGTVFLTLSDTILLLLQNNYDLKNATLARIVDKQRLREAESQFEPRIEPSVGVGISQSLSGSIVPPVALGGGSEADRLDDGTVINRAVQLQGTLETPLGTELSLTINPFFEQTVGLSITQPLLRGFGIPVNTAPVNQARLGEIQNQFDLQDTLIDQITGGIFAYRNLIAAQETLRIQRLSLEDQFRQREVIQALIEAGRQARIRLVEIDANIATTQTAVLNAENALEQAKSDLLRLLDLPNFMDMGIPELVIEQLRQEVIVPDLPSLQALTEIAYQNRPDYQQAQLDIEIADLDELVARDNKRWSLDLQADARFTKASDLSTALVLSREFGNESLTTDVISSQIDGVSLENDLANLANDIQLEVEDNLRDIASARDRILSTRTARELAEQRLEIARIRGANIFEILELQNNVTNAQNDEVSAAIDLQDALSELERTIGTTLETWQTEIDQSGVLQLPSNEAL